MTLSNVSVCLAFFRTMFVYLPRFKKKICYAKYLFAIKYANAQPHIDNTGKGKKAMGILKPLQAMFFGEIQYPHKKKIPHMPSNDAARTVCVCVWG